MKKLFKLALMLITVCLLTIGAPEIARAEGAQQAFKTVAVTDGNNRGAATLYGSGDNYITDLKVRVEFKNHAPYEIALEDGYSPFIAALDFGAEDKLLFCSSQTGGSGGYGNYRIYRVKTDSYQLLYDDKTDSKAYTYRARFLIGGFMDIYDCTTENDLIVPACPSINLGYGLALLLAFELFLYILKPHSRPPFALLCASFRAHCYKSIKPCLRAFQAIRRFRGA